VKAGRLVAQGRSRRSVHATLCIRTRYRLAPRKRKKTVSQDLKKFAKCYPARWPIEGKGKPGRARLLLHVLGERVEEN